MHAKLPCNKCGVLILPATYEKNMGLCMPCKKGTREAIKLSKSYKEHNKKVRAWENSPYVLRWRELDSEYTKSDGSLKGLSKHEQQFYAVGLLNVCVNEGGFLQFFDESNSEIYDHAVAGLTNIGAYEPLKLLIRAQSIIIGSEDFNNKTPIRNKLLECEATEKELKYISNEYITHRDYVHKLNEQHAIDNNVIKIA